MTSVVYYLRRGDLIKIGWSGNLKARMRALRPDELLAVEPGCIHIETGRHHQFAEYRLPNAGDGDEWFTAAPELLAHVELITRMYPTPDLAELMPTRRAGRGPRPQLITIIPPVPSEELALLGRVAAARDRDPSEMSRDELAQAIRDFEAVFDESQRWVGRLVAELRRRDRSWAYVSRLTGVAPTTLRNRTAKHEEAGG